MTFHVKTLKSVFKLGSVRIFEIIRPALRIKKQVDRVLGTTDTLKNLVPWCNFFSTDLSTEEPVFWQHYAVV